MRFNNYPGFDLAAFNEANPGVRACIIAATNEVSILRICDERTQGKNHNERCKNPASWISEMGLHLCESCMRFYDPEHYNLRPFHQT